MWSLQSFYWKPIVAKIIYIYRQHVSAARLNDINRYGSIWRQVDAISVYFCCVLSYRKVWVQFCWADISYFLGQIRSGPTFSDAQLCTIWPDIAALFSDQHDFPDLCFDWLEYVKQPIISSLWAFSHPFWEKRELGSPVSTSSLVSSAFISIHMMYKFIVRSSHCCTWASQYAHVF